MERRSKPKVNSGWYHCIHPEYGHCWSGRGVSADDGEILVRKILFSVRKPNRRYTYQTNEQRSKRFIKVGRYYEYMKREWGVTQKIHGIKRNFAFRKWIENRWKNDRREI